MALLLQRYSHALKRWPLAANATQGGAIGATGDAICQKYVDQDADAAQPLDRRRTAMAATIGVGFSAFLYPVLYRRLEAAFPGLGVRAVVAKALSDCALFGVFGNASSLYFRGAEPDDVLQKMPGVLLNEMRVWLPYNLFAFRLVPLHVRPTTTACLSLCWNVYMSYTAANDDEEVAAIYRTPTRLTSSPSGTQLERRKSEGNR